MRGGIARAKQCGFTLRGPIRLYLEVLAILGHRFGDDPQYPAIAAILADPAYGSEMDRAQALFDAVLDYRDWVIGADQRCLYPALEGLCAMAENPVTAERTPGDLVDMLWYVYPEKALYVGVDVLRALIRESQALIRAFGLAEPPDEILACTLMMIFGHGCFDDPFLPWIAQAMAQDPGGSAPVGGRLLRQRTQAQVRQMLAKSMAHGR